MMNKNGNNYHSTTLNVKLQYIKQGWTALCTTTARNLEKNNNERNTTNGQRHVRNGA